MKPVLAPSLSRGAFVSELVGRGAGRGEVPFGKPGWDLAAPRATPDELAHERAARKAWREYGFQRLPEHEIDGLSEGLRRRDAVLHEVAKPLYAAVQERDLVIAALTQHLEALLDVK